MAHRRLMINLRFSLVTTWQTIILLGKHFLLARVAKSRVFACHWSKDLYLMFLAVKQRVNETITTLTMTLGFYLFHLLSIDENCNATWITCYKMDM